MNRKRLSVFVTICIACIMIIIGEWFYALWMKQHTPNTTNASPSTQLLDEMPVIELLQQPETSYVDFINRPLFIKGRKPVNEPLPETMLAGETLANTFDWQLNGIYTTANGLSALFSRSSAKATKNAHRKITIGAELDGWKLTEIYMDRVLLEQNNQSKELLLQKPKSKALSKNITTPLANDTPLQIPNTPPPAQAPNPFNTPNSPPSDVGDSENIDNDNP
ncbi:MAG: hypothetical protein NT008_04365 [Methylococcales bacterium]|nr:hypothetical protein [Methylococcales bacterium]